VLSIAFEERRQLLGFGGLPEVTCRAGREGFGEAGFYLGEGGVGGSVGKLVRVGFEVIEFLKAIAVTDKPVTRIRHGM
jgi:hypothetical protein